MVGKAVSYTEDDTDADAEECEPTGTFVPAAMALVDDGEGAEEHV